MEDAGEQRRYSFYVGDEALEKLAVFCRDSSAGREVVLVADSRTFEAAGRAAGRALEGAGCSVSPVVLSGDVIHPDECSLARLLVRTPEDVGLFVAVGAGTLHDITRYTSHRLGVPFVSVPTAASVDGYTSAGAPLIIEGLKETYPCRPPAAIFADREVLANAPFALTAAGFGDVVGKLTCLGDWRLGRAVRDEPFDETIAQETATAVSRCIFRAEAIGKGSPEAVEELFRALAKTGEAMAGFGASHPASGGEHHISHFWDMAAIREGRPAALHGAQVAVGTVLTAGLYERVRSIDAAEAESLLAGRLPLDRAQQEQEIRDAYGEASGVVIAAHRPYLDLSAEDQRRIAETVVRRWDAVQDVASTVPSRRRVVELLEQAGAPTTPEQIGIDAEQAARAVRYGHYVRNRFTVAKLSHMLGVLDSALGGER